jgi:hypothetical protein
VPVVEYHPGEVLLAADPDGLLVEVWQAGAGGGPARHEIR